MATTKQNAASDNGSPHFPKEDKTSTKEDSAVHSVIPSSKDVFRGEVLVNRLLVYYSKFEGSREKAVRYAQKLLDLGHIESLTHGQTFEDTPHVYRWTDVAQVMNKSKTSGRWAAAETVKKPPRRSPPKNGESPKAILKISIETDNCEGADIQARIRAQPRPGANRLSAPFDTKTVTAAGTEDSFFGPGVTKALSYVTEPTNEELNREAVVTPLITEISPSPPKNVNKSPKVKEISSPPETQAKNPRTPLPRERSVEGKLFSKTETKNTSEQKDVPRKSLFGNAKNEGSKPKYVGQNSDGSEAPKPTFKSATEPAMFSRKRAPGPGATEVTEKNVEDVKPKAVNHPSGKDKTSSTPESREAVVKHSPTAANERKSSSPRGEENKGATGATGHNGEVDKGLHEFQPTLIASTQTSEKSILRASKLYDGRDGNKQPPPQGVTTQTTSSLFKRNTSDHVTPKDDVTQAKSRELQRANEHKKKTRFADEDSGCCASVVNGQVQRNESELTKESTGMSLHSSGFVEDVGQNGTDYSIHVPVSPPPPSPVPRTSPQVPQEANLPQLKSLFWNKISKQRRAPSDGERVFWDEVEDIIVFNEEQFEKLFSRPPAALPSPRGKGQSRSQNSGKTLKVLGIERSRMVGIRASTVRIPVEEIHDTIINMDDEKLDIDSLQALYDIRPTPEELDEIADALKANPKGILDKPEQFILMLAMIPNLDERLECWIFAKRFPDKMVEIQEQLTAVTEACQQIVNNSTLRRVLETVLLLGNYMNRGTQRGDAYGYHLDILPKLKDVKSQGGEVTLLQYTVRTVRDQMKAEGKLENEGLISPRMDDNCGLPDHSAIMRAVSASMGELGDDLESTAVELEDCKQRLLPVIIKGSTIPAESEIVEEKLDAFLSKATAKMREQAQMYQDTLAVAEEFQNYFVPASRTETREPFSFMLQSIGTFCEEFRAHWMEEMRQDLKEQFCKLERGKRQRINALRVTNTPSALKERFMERRRREKRTVVDGRSSAEVKPHSVLSFSLPRQANESLEDAPRRSESKAKRSYKFQSEGTRDSVTPSNGYTHSGRSSAEGRRRAEEADFLELAQRNSKEIERRMNELSSKKRENVLNFKT